MNDNVALCLLGNEIITVIIIIYSQFIIDLLIYCFQGSSSKPIIVSIYL